MTETAKPITPEQLSANCDWLRSKGVAITDEQAAMIQTCLAHGIELTNELALVAEAAAFAFLNHEQEFLGVACQ